MKKIIISGLVLLVISAAGGSIYAGEVNTGFFNNTAIGGYDSVAYFLEGSPRKGSAKFSTLWKGADWRFQSKENLDLFLSDPERYAPQFGGFCANGLSEGEKVKGKYYIWRIYKDKLYLFYSEKGRTRWDADKDNKIELAIEYWKIVQFD